MRDLIGELRRDRRAVLVSTHNLSEAEQLADRIAVLKTELLAFDTPSVLRTRGQGIEVSIEFEDGSRHLATVTELAEVADLVHRLVLEGRRVVRVSPGRRSLEDVYLSLVGAEP